jgi:two-component system, chemotaxis family, chemotaxis protein CheY
MRGRMAQRRKITARVRMELSMSDTSMPILIVDDSQTIRSIVLTHLKSLGFTDVDFAEDGQLGVEKIKQKQYGLIISDWEMPRMSGEQFLKAVRQHVGYMKVPIIVLTSAAVRGTSWLAGANAFLRKPFTEADLRNAIKTVTTSY